MAQPESTSTQLDGQLQEIIHSLYALMLQTYDYHETTGSRAMTTQIQKLVKSLQQFSNTSQNFNITIPPNVIGFVETGRNPDIYTRLFVENTQLMNQQLKGREEAFEAFAEVLGAEIVEGLPELAGEVDKVLRK